MDQSTSQAGPPAEILAQLRDIHPGGELPWWPPAPGWWLLAALLLGLLLLTARHLLRRHLAKRRRRELLDHLDALADRHRRDEDPQGFLAAVNSLLKLVALRAFPDRGCAALRGEQWVRFLQGQVTDAKGAGALAALADGPYRQSMAYDHAALHGAARDWIRRHG